MFGDQLDRLALFGSQSFVSSLTFCTVLIWLTNKFSSSSSCLLRICKVTLKKKMKFKKLVQLKVWYFGSLAWKHFLIVPNWENKFENFIPAGIHMIVWNNNVVYRYLIKCLNTEIGRGVDMRCTLTYTFMSRKSKIRGRDWIICTTVQYSGAIWGMLSR